VLHFLHLEKSRFFLLCAPWLQAVDGLEVSGYLRELADGYVRGELRLDETGELIRSYHMPGSGFLERFFDNQANNASHELIREELLCPALFDNPSLLRNVSPSLALHKKTQ